MNLTPNEKRDLIKPSSTPPPESPHLTPNEKRDLVKLIEADKPLPDVFRFKLFADKREADEFTRELPLNR